MERALGATNRAYGDDVLRNVQLYLFLKIHRYTAKRFMQHWLGLIFGAKGVKSMHKPSLSSPQDSAE